MIGGLVIGLLGLAASRVLFFGFPSLKEGGAEADAGDVSVVIPARNEALTLPHLLNDINAQTVRPCEVICVDDESTDGTALVAASLGARVVATPQRPEGWLGKPWACETGMRAAKGARILFLDADVRLAPDALLTLLSTHGDGGSVVSVQPYHCVQKGYEQLSLFFNALQFGANGATLPRPRGTGLYGPVILIGRRALTAIGGFSGVCASVIEDFAFGKVLRNHGIAYRLFSGGRHITFRMYQGGIGSLVEGWTKNIASGAAGTPPLLFGLVCFWITGSTSTALRLILSAARGAWREAALLAALYLLWALELRRIARKLGSFRRWVSAFYPIPLGFYLFVFLKSCLKKAMKRPVRWKGRDIHWEK